MKINSKHLFNYIYYPGSLTEEEYLFIKGNREIFEEELKLLRESYNQEKQVLSKDVEDEILNNVLKNISKKH